MQPWWAEENIKNRHYSKLVTGIVNNVSCNMERKHTPLFIIRALISVIQMTFDLLHTGAVTLGLSSEQLQTISSSII